MQDLYRSGHVLIVEDDLAMQSMIRDFLQFCGYKTTCHRFATEALEALKSTFKPIDLIVSDINMPQMTGIEFLSEVRKLTPAIPVIMITAFGTDLTEKEVLAEGAFAYLAKPFKLRDLKKLIENARSMAG